MLNHLKKYKSIYCGGASVPFADRLAENISTIFAWLLSYITTMPDVVRLSLKEIFTMVVVGLVIGVVSPSDVQDTKKLVADGLEDWLKRGGKSDTLGHMVEYSRNL